MLYCRNRRQKKTVSLLLFEKPKLICKKPFGLGSCQPFLYSGIEKAFHLRIEKKSKKVNPGLLTVNHTIILTVQAAQLTFHLYEQHYIKAVQQFTLSS